MALQAPQSKDIAAAINSLLKLNAADQGSLLETIDEYFISPSSSDDDLNKCQAEPETSSILIII